MLGYDSTRLLKTAMETVSEVEMVVEVRHISYDMRLVCGVEEAQSALVLDLRVCDKAVSSFFELKVGNGLRSRRRLTAVALNAFRRRVEIKDFHFATRKRKTLKEAHLGVTFAFEVLELDASGGVGEDLALLAPRLLLAQLLGFCGYTLASYPDSHL